MHAVALDEWMRFRHYAGGALPSSRAECRMAQQQLRCPLSTGLPLISALGLTPTHPDGDPCASVHKAVLARQLCMAPYPLSAPAHLASHEHLQQAIYWLAQLFGDAFGASR